MAEYGFDKLCHKVFSARDNGVDFLSRGTGVKCGRCGHELVAYYCESRLYMVQCRHCAIKSLVMAKDRKEAAEKICGCAADVVEIPESGIGDLTDGYHSFNELYHHRAVLFAALCNLLPDRAWKSMRHHDGDMYDGMFIVGIETPEGQATYHYDVDPYWDMFHVKALRLAPEWDGHTPSETLRRILILIAKETCDYELLP